MDVYSIICRHDFMYLDGSRGSLCDVGYFRSRMEGISSSDPSKDHLLEVSSFFDNNVRIISYDSHTEKKSTYFVSGRDGDGGVWDFLRLISWAACRMIFLGSSGCGFFSCILDLLASCVGGKCVSGSGRY